MSNATAKFSETSKTVTAAGAHAGIAKIGPNAVGDLLISGPSANVLRAVAALGYSRTSRREIPADKLHGARVSYDLSDVDGRVVGSALVTKDGGSATILGFAK